jgi:hypothetical protein
LPAKRTTYNAAPVPSSVEIIIAVAASRSEKNSESMNGLLLKKWVYQRSEKPCGGKVRSSPALKDARTMITSGSSRKQ